MSDTAKTILAQLGGNRFLVMTGAKHIFSDNGGKALVFQLPRGARDGINAVRIELDASDTYTATKVREVSFVYADQLQTLFTSTTGLAVSL